MSVLSRLALAGALVLGMSSSLPVEAQAQNAATIAGLKFIGGAIVPFNFEVDGTKVGGLSGLDYDPKANIWYALSDDRSDKNPARFYTLKLSFTGNSFAGVVFDHAVTLLQANGQPYPNAKAGGDVPDPEALRVDPETGNLWWTSEGDRKLGLDPFVRVAATDGRHVATLPGIPLFAMNKDAEKGPRNNNAFEGLSFAPDAKSAWIGMEAAIYEDGPISTVEAGSVARVTQIDRAGKVLSQFAYPVDAIPMKPTGKYADNGVPEILALGNGRFLMLERAGVQGADDIWKTYIRLYEVDATGATDIKDMASLKGAEYKPATKRLVLDLTKEPTLGGTDNIECLSFGPKLANGHQTLVVASDNNFSTTEFTQFLAFEILP
jgi:hypothetical protein